MKKILFLIAFLALTSPALACSGTECSDIQIDQVRLVSVDTATRPTAMFLTLKNSGQTTRTLTAVTTPVCGRAELHDHILDGDVMRMRKIDRVEIPAGGTVVFMPMGKHVMCFDPVLPMVLGSETPVTFTFVGEGKSHALTAVVPAKIISFKQAMGPP